MDCKVSKKISLPIHDDRIFQSNGTKSQDFSVVLPVIATVALDGK
jgi:hypothetical protein